MKKLLAASLLISAVLGASSCKEEVDLIGDFKETAIVYGLLDQSDSVHMIKIMRAFVGPGNAEDIAQISDSNYFQSVDAVVSEIMNGLVTRTWTLQDTIITDKDPNGAFFAPDQKLYFFETSPSAPLDPNATYHLAIDIDNGKFKVEGETGIVDGLSSGISNQNTQFKFVTDPAEYTSQAIYVNTGNSYVVNTRVRTHFNEHIGATSTPTSFDWNIGESPTTPGSQISFSANGETFYQLLADKCSQGDPSVDKRSFNSFEITITAGAEELYNYMLVNEPSSSLAQSKPTYTNLTATNDFGVVGIFSSRQTLKIDKPFFVSAAQAYIRAIDKKSTSELCIGPITGPYFFCSHHPGDNVLGSEEPYACQ